MSNVDINVDRRTENRTPISHPATSRCDKKKGVYNFDIVTKEVLTLIIHCNFQSSVFNTFLRK